MKSKMIFTGIFLMTTLIASVSHSENLSAQYMLKLKDDVQSVTTLKDSFKKNPQSFCPDYSGPVATVCLNRHLAAMPLKSSTHVVLLTTVIVGIALEDAKAGKISREEAKVTMVDTILGLYERMDTKKFHLAELKTVTGQDQLELQMLRKQDVEMISQQVKKISDIISQNLKDVAASRSIAGDGGSIAGKTEELKKRLLALVAVKWNYS